MKKIAIDARESGTTTGRYIDKLIEYLHELAPPFEFIILTKQHRLSYFSDIAPNFTTIESPFKEFTFDEQLSLPKQLHKLKPDLIHFSMVHQPLLYRGTTVTTMHDLTTCRFRNPSKNAVIFTIKQTVYKFINWYIPRKSSQLIVPSEFVKRDVMQFAHVGPDKFTVTYESSDPISDKPTPLPDLTNSSFIMYVGRPLPAKNLWRLVEAFRILQQTHPALQLVLVGKKDILYERIEEQVKQLGISNVVFAGFVSEGELRWLYEHAAVYAFPSLSEGFGLPGLEAMRLGAPVVSSNATCLPEIYGTAAHYFNPLDVPDMAHKIGEVLDNKNLHDRLVDSGKAQAAKYSWKRMAEQTIAVYQKALKE